MNEKSPSPLIVNEKVFIREGVHLLVGFVIGFGLGLLLLALYSSRKRDEIFWERVAEHGCQLVSESSTRDKWSTENTCVEPSGRVWSR